MALTLYPADPMPEAPRKGRPCVSDVPRREARALVVSELVAAGAAVKDLARRYRVSGRTIKRWAAAGRKLAAS